MMPPIEVRTAQPADAQSVIALIRSVLAEQAHFALLPHEYDRTEEAQRRLIEACAAAGRSLILVALSGHAIIGLIELQADQRARMAHVATITLAVDQRHRRQGVGACLLQSAIDRARAKGLIEKLCLGVLSTNAPALALYRQAGFTNEGTRRGAVKLAPGQTADEILMSLSLPTPGLT